MRPLLLLVFSFTFVVASPAAVILDADFADEERYLTAAAGGSRLALTIRASDFRSGTPAGLTTRRPVLSLLKTISAVDSNAWLRLVLGATFVGVICRTHRRQSSDVIKLAESLRVRKRSEPRRLRHP